MIDNMDADPDELPPPGEEDLDWSDETAQLVKSTKPKGQYSKISDAARSFISTERQCALFCGGKKCKYCSSEGWGEDEMVIKGLYSQWVTDNILAMARPSTTGVRKYDQVKQFKKLGINSIVNLQISGEHADCGPNKLDSSGFLYNPQAFMEEKIFFYNFGWPDYGVASLSTILDMVKVMQFAVSQGKVAVHCHAGRGRTGVIIACYLVFTNRISGTDAIHYVREKRPGSIQTRQQMQVIQEFEKYLRPFRTVFASRPDKEDYNDGRQKGSHEFSLHQYLNRQRHMLHGFEARRLKYIPKVVYAVCERLLELAQKHSSVERVESQPELRLEKTFSSLSNVSVRSKKTSLAQKLRKNVSKDSLKSLEEAHSKPEHHKLKIFGDTRHRYRSMSLEDLHNDEFKNVLNEPDSQSVGSSGSGSEKFHIQKPKFNIEEEDEEEEDDDASIMFGYSCTDIKAEASNGPSSSSNEGHKALQHKTSVMSEWSIDGSLAGELSESSAALVVDALSADSTDVETRKKADILEHQLNETDSAWTSLSSETDPHVLSLVMWDWLDQLKEPVLRVQDLTHILSHIKDPPVGLQKVEKGIRYTIEYMVKVISKLQPLDQSVHISIHEKLISHLTQQWVTYEDIDVTSSWALSTKSSLATLDGNQEKDHWTEMKGTMAQKLFKFFFNLANDLQRKQQSKKSGGNVL